jgi:hypothetical protein
VQSLPARSMLSKHGCSPIFFGRSKPNLAWWEEVLSSFLDGQVCCTILWRLGTFSGEKPQLTRSIVRDWNSLVSRDIYREESPRALFKGLGPTLVGVIPARSINFFTYGNGKQIIAENFNHGRENSFVHLAAAAFAGIVTGTATNPIWVVKTRMQLSASKRLQAELSYSTSSSRNLLGGSWATIKEIMRHEGVRGFYKGLSASYLGVTEGTIQWVLYERLKSISSRTQEKGGMQEWFGMLASAGTAKFVASLITYPHEVRSGFCLITLRADSRFPYA